MINYTEIDTLIDADAEHDAYPFDDSYGSLDRTVDAAALAEVPQAFLAYLDCQQNQWS